MELILGPGNAKCSLLQPRDILNLSNLIRLNFEELKQWLPGFGDEFDPEVPATYLERAFHEHEHKSGFHFGIWVEETLVGVVNLNAIDEYSKSASIGFFLDSRFQGKGLATRSCQAVVGWAFEDLGLNRVSMEIMTDNLRSVAVATRLGFQYEGVKRSAERVGNRFVDHAIFALLAQDLVKAA